MEQFLKKGSSGAVVRLYSKELKQEDESIHEELKCTLENHHKVL
jgi:hypothetical protein